MFLIHLCENKIKGGGGGVKKNKKTKEKVIGKIGGHIDLKHTSWVIYTSYNILFQ